LIDHTTGFFDRAFGAVGRGGTPRQEIKGSE
jgi:hypothetical protein